MLLLWVSHIGRSTHRNHQDSVRDLVVVSRVRLLLEVPPSTQPLPRHGTTRVMNVVCKQPVRYVVLMFAQAVLVVQQIALLLSERGQQVHLIFVIFQRGVP